MPILKQELRFAKPLMLLFAPFFASLSVTASPGLAATFAYSQAEVSIKNFSHNPGLNPEDIVTISNTYTGLFFEEGEAAVNSQAKVDFITEPDPQDSSIENISFTQGEADSEKYVVLGESFANAQGYNFLIAAGEIFSFNLKSLLELIAIRIPSLIPEGAYAEGAIALDLYNQNTGERIDYLTIASSLDTSGSGDFITSEFSDSFALDINSKDISLTDTVKFARAEIQGKYFRLFSEDTSLALIETKTNRIIIRTPEPSNHLSLLIGGLLVVGFVSKVKRTQKIPTKVNS